MKNSQYYIVGIILIMMANFTDKLWVCLMTAGVGILNIAFYLHFTLKELKKIEKKIDENFLERMKLINQSIKNAHSKKAPN